MQLYHLHIEAHDVAESAAFYETYFGFRRAWPGAPEVFLRSDDGFLLAIGPRSGAGTPAPPEWFHVGFRAQSAAEARALLDRLAAGGVRIVVPWTEIPGGTVKFHCTDPAGYQIEVRWDAPE